MGISHRFHECYAELLIKGSISTGDLLTGFERLMNAVLVKTKARILINVTNSDILPSLSVMEQIAGIIGTSQQKLTLRIAILVAQEVRYGRARQLSTFLETYNVIARPFYSRDEAINWLLIS